MNAFPPQDALASAWKSGLSNEVKRVTAAFLLIWALTFVAGVLSQQVMDGCTTLFSSTTDSMSAIDLMGVSAILQLFSNNIQATAMMMLDGVFPFLRLGALPLGMNAMMLGWMAAYYVRSGLPLGLYAAALVPHAVFELPALILALSISLYTCEQVTRSLRGDSAARSFTSCLILMGQALLFPLFPLLLLAACVEAYLTPLLAAFFMGL